jgi:BolA family transcriptional regulator, general stress-responsive regulator
MSATVRRMRERLSALAPVQLDITDESARHAGHAGAASGGGHFRLHIVSSRFDGLNTVARHRLIYSTLGDMMQKDIHALSIDARSSSEI